MLGTGNENPHSPTSGRTGDDTLAVLYSGSPTLDCEAENEEEPTSGQISHIIPAVRVVANNSSKWGTK